MADDTEVVGIDEGQFFDASLPAACNTLADRGKRVIVAGLDQDYLGRPFEPMPQLLAIAEYITKTLAICVVCGDPANHTQRLVASSDRVLVGAHGRVRGALPPLLRSDPGVGGPALAARGGSPAAFGRRCIPSPPQRGCRVGDPGSGCVAPRSNIPDILARRALPAGRISGLGAAPDFHHGLLATTSPDRLFRSASGPCLCPASSAGARLAVRAKTPTAARRDAEDVRARAEQTAPLAAPDLTTEC